MKVKFRQRIVNVDRHETVNKLMFFMAGCIALVAMAVVPVTYVKANEASNMPSEKSESMKDSSYEDEIGNLVTRSLESNTSLPDIMVKTLEEDKTIPSPIEMTCYNLTQVPATTSFDLFNYQVKAAADEMEPDLASEEALKEHYQNAEEEQRRMEEDRQKLIAEKKRLAEEEAKRKATEKHLDLSEKEYNILLRIVEAEVTGTCGVSREEAINSKFRVARVIINRVLSPKFPNTVEGVVFQSRQFSPIGDGRYWQVTPTDLTKEAVDRALLKSVPDDIPGALFFTRTMFNREYILTDAVGHNFFR